MAQSYASPINAFEAIAAKLIREIRACDEPSSTRFNWVEDVSDMVELFAEVARVADMAPVPARGPRLRIAFSAGVGR